MSSGMLEADYSNFISIVATICRVPLVKDDHFV